MLASLKTLFTFLLAGAFGGLATASWLGPKWLEWNNTTNIPVAQTMCNLPEVVRSVAAQLLGYQLTGTGTGAAVGLALGTVYLVARRRKGPPPSVPRVPPTVPEV